MWHHGRSSKNCCDHRIFHGAVCTFPGEVRNLRESVSLVFSRHCGARGVPYEVALLSCFRFLPLANRLASQVLQPRLPIVQVLPPPWIWDQVPSLRLERFHLYVEWFPESFPSIFLHNDELIFSIQKNTCWHRPQFLFRPRNNFPL